MVQNYNTSVWCGLAKTQVKHMEYYQNKEMLRPVLFIIITDNLQSSLKNGIFYAFIGQPVSTMHKRARLLCGSGLMFLGLEGRVRSLSGSPLGMLSSRNGRNKQEAAELRTVHKPPFPFTAGPPSQSLCNDNVTTAGAQIERLM